MKLNKLMFREYDIRGIWNEDITEEISYHIGRAFATKLLSLGKNKMLVGYDNRLSSPIIEENLIKGLTEGGVNVVRLGLVTTPMYYYGWDKLNIHAGIMITASHNPKEYNGFKMSYNGIHNIYGEDVSNLYYIIQDGNYSVGNGTIEYKNIKKDYVEMIHNHIDMGNNKLKVVYDCGNGTTAVVASEIFKNTSNIEYIPLFAESDGTFPNHHPDPAVEDNLKTLKEKVLEVKADCGIAFDGDGDRVGVVDEKGNMVDIDKYMIIIWKSLINTNVEKKTFFDVKCSLCLKEELEKMNVNAEFYRTGNSYTKAKSVEGNYPFGGELSGHVFFRDRFGGYDDGIYAGLRLIEILTNNGKTVSEMLEGINKYYSTPEIKIHTEDNIKFNIVNKVKEYCKNKNYNILDIDGVKVFFDDGSALVRASNTGPNITARFEAKSESRLEDIKNEFLNLVDNLKDQ